MYLLDLAHDLAHDLATPPAKLGVGSGSLQRLGLMQTGACDSREEGSRSKADPGEVRESGSSGSQLTFADKMQFSPPAVMQKAGVLRARCGPSAVK